MWIYLEVILKINLLFSLLWIALSCEAQPLFDPTRPYQKQSLKPKPTKMELTSIVEVNGSYSAMINHRKVKVGSTIYGLTIKHIDTNRVVLSNNQVLRLFKAVRIKE